MRPPSGGVQTAPSRCAHAGLTTLPRPSPRVCAPRNLGSNALQLVRVRQFRVLGPLEVADGDGAPVALGGQKQRALPALLLLRANEVVPTERLVDQLWGENA